VSAQHHLHASGEYFKKSLKSYFKSFSLQGRHFSLQGDTIMDEGILFLLPAAFGASLVLALLLYWVGGRIKPKLISHDARKTESYACGEVLPVGVLRVDLERFLIFAVYFLIFDVLAFTIATSFTNLGLAPMAYCLIVLMAVAMLVISRRHQ
jgi:NADH:ubiquinone oxidoreductase subunit 3 (subunit A)